MAEIYNVGTVDAVSGSKTLVLDGGVWSNLVVRSGDMIVVAGTHINFVETVTDTTHVEMAIGYDGATASDLDYAILHGSYEWGLHRTQNELVAQYIQGLENPVRIDFGAGVPDVGLGSDNGLYIDTATGDMYVKTDGVWAVELNLKGPRGLGGTVAIGTVATGAAGSSAEVENVGTPEEAVLNFSIPQGGAGNDGLNGILSAAQYVKTNDYVVVGADKGKTLIADRATAISFDFDAAATLTSDFMVIVKNEGAGTLTINPDGAETIDGDASLDLEQGSSLAVYADGVNLRTALAGGGGGDMSGANNLSELTDVAAARANLGAFAAAGGTLQSMAAAPALSMPLVLKNSSDGGVKLPFSNAVCAELASISASVMGVGSGTDDGVLKFSTSRNSVPSVNMTIDEDGHVLKPKQPAFSVRHSAPWVQATGVNKFTPQDTAIENVGNHYNPSTGRYTAPKAGLHLFKICTASQSGQPAQAYVDAELYVNGGRSRIGGWDNKAAGYWAVSAFFLVPLLQGDYVEPATELAVTATLYSSNLLPTFEGYLIG